MRLASSPYAGRLITFATMHGKERLAQESFHNVLGATVTATSGLDTDQFGTFVGDIPRTLTPHAAAHTKARLGMQLAGTSLGLASEGSFGSGLGPVVENVELLVFIDDDLGLELVEGAVGASQIPGGMRVKSVSTALAFASTVGFPEQGVILQGTLNGHTTVHKNLRDAEAIEAAALALLEQHCQVMIIPDYRAHLAPARSAKIRALCERMAGRLATPCPHCLTPGFGQVEVEHGLACSQCHSPTQVIAADIFGCGRCEHRARMPRAAALADPRWCDYCNP